MADNYITDPGAGGVTFASDEDGGLVHWPLVKLAWGALNTFNVVEDAAGKRVPVDSVQSGAWSVSITGTVAVTQSGAWSVSITGSVAVTNAGVFAVQENGAALTALQLIDDPVQVLGTDTYTEATSKGITLGAVRRDADTSLVNLTNEFAPLQVDALGRLKVEVFSGETLPVSGTFFQATQPVSIAATVTVDSELPAAAALADNTANPTVPAVGSFLMAWDGTNWDRVQTGAAATGSLKVDGSAVTQPVSGTVTANLAAGTNTNEFVGDAAHDAAIAGNPMRVGARALTADYTAVATGDTADLIATILGKLVVKPYALPGQQWQFASATGGLTDTTAVTIKAAGAAGVRNYVTDLLVVNGHATVSTEVVIRDGAAGTVIHRGFAQAAGGGYSIKFGSPLRGTAATLLEVVCITTGAAVRVSASGYEGAE